jgi:hypothetical protein
MNLDTITTDDLYMYALLRAFKESFYHEPADDELNFAVEYLKLDIAKDLTKHAEAAADVAMFRSMKNRHDREDQNSDDDDDEITSDTERWRVNVPQEKEEKFLRFCEEHGVKIRSVNVVEVDEAAAAK